MARDLELQTWIEAPGRGAPPRARAPWGEQRRRPGGELEVLLAGPLPEGWALSLTRALADRGWSLRNGYARGDAAAGWLAELEVVPDLAAEAASPDFLALALGGPPPLAPPVPRVLDFDLREADSFGGCLTLQVDAWDALGLLAGVLGEVDRAGLAPVEMILETEEDCAFHHLAARAQGGGRPRPRQGRVLEAGMDRLLRRL